MSIHEGKIAEGGPEKPSVFTKRSGRRRKAPPKHPPETGFSRAGRQQACFGYAVSRHQTLQDTQNQALSAPQCFSLRQPSVKIELNLCRLISSRRGRCYSRTWFSFLWPCIKASDADSCFQRRKKQLHLPDLAYGPGRPFKLRNPPPLNPKAVQTPNL